MSTSLSLCLKSRRLCSLSFSRTQNATSIALSHGIRLLLKSTRDRNMQQACRDGRATDPGGIAGCGSSAPMLCFGALACFGSGSIPLDRFFNSTLRRRGFDLLQFLSVKIIDQMAHLGCTSSELVGVIISRKYHSPPKSCGSL